MNSVKDEQMKYIIEKIIKGAKDLQKETAGRKKTQFEEGLIQGYSEVIDTIRSQMIVDDRDLEEFGLKDIDHNKLFS